MKLGDALETIFWLAFFCFIGYLAGVAFENGWLVY